MRIRDIIIALVVALAAFAVLKLIGMVLKLAFFAGLLGLVAGFVLARVIWPKKS